MINRLVTAIPVLALACCPGGARAEVITGTITADNHYAVYSAVGSAFAYHGGNETGAGGSPGPYNWSLAETLQFEAGDILYVAAWSDDAVAQGLIAQFESASLGKLLSGDLRWQVYATGVNRADGEPHPTISFIAGHVADADAAAAWQSPYMGGANGAGPWGAIAGIDSTANWMWRDTPGDPDPLLGGSGLGEVLIFRTNVPAPSEAALLGLGGLAAIRRRR